MDATERKRKIKRVVVWFRQDLRLLDNEALHEAMQRAEEVIPVYVFDARTFQGKTSFGFPKTGKFRAQFILESVQNLRQNLKAIGSNLIVRTGLPEEEVFQLVKEADASLVFCNMERSHEEVEVQNALEQKLWSIGREINYFRGKMLLYTQDLPFPVSHTPDQFSQFRKEVEKIVPIRPLIEKPIKLQAVTPLINPGNMPSLANLGHKKFKSDPRKAIDFTGGETAALKRIQYYLWDTDLISTYKETRNELSGPDYSSKLSAWLAQGCISPKYVYHQIKKYEEERMANESTFWLFFELLWRDFFRLMLKKHGNHVFQPGGTKGVERTDLSENRELFEKWANGQTGVHFVDANMTELNLTGFMSNRGRQNVASYLVNDLKINWLMGAEYFESMLIDYDPASNYGNWAYIGGVGSDSRENRYFNIARQAEMYDPEGRYVKKWLSSTSTSA